MKSIHLAFLACLLASDFASASVSLLDGEKLSKALKESPPCCVIDGRSQSQRTKVPLKEALPYRRDLEINPTATVVVLADNDQEALRIGGLLEKKHPGKAILAVKGGLTSWKAAMTVPDSANAADGAPKGSFQFVIPHNTCEVGTPLQKLQSKPK